MRWLELLLQVAAPRSPTVLEGLVQCYSQHALRPVVAPLLPNFHGSPTSLMCPFVTPAPFLTPVQEGLVEYYWGEHIHLGYYSDQERKAGYLKKDFKKVRTRVRFAGWEEQS